MMLDYRTSIGGYSLHEFPLAQLVERHFAHPLDKLHEHAPAVHRLEVGRDQQTLLHRKFYEITAEFWEAYRAFVCGVALEGLDASEYYFQARPTFRVQLPMNVATGGFHRDSDYNHPREELNFLVPLTAMGGTNSVWVESEPGAADFLPQRMEVGQYLRFHGAVLSHGSWRNVTGRTRVSLDFRVLPKAKYVAEGRRTVNQGMELAPGAYYAQL